jgi:hypothetical protein
LFYGWYKVQYENVLIPQFISAFIIPELSMSPVDLCFAPYLSHFRQAINSRLYFHCYYGSLKKYPNRKNRSVEESVVGDFAVEARTG